MDESPEQVLARLARHRDSVFRARGLPVRDDSNGSGPQANAPKSDALLAGSPGGSAGSVALAPPIGAWISPHPSPTEFIPAGSHTSELGWQLSQSAVLVTIFGLLLGVISAGVAILAFEGLSSAAALVIVAVMVVAGLVATAKRVPTALWFTVGAAIGGILGRWS